MSINIGNTTLWATYVGNTTSQNYILTSSLTFNNTISGNLQLQSGRIFDGQNNKIYLTDINNFNGLFNLNSGNTTTTIQNLKIICSNVTISNNKGIVVDGSIDRSIVSNGILSNVEVFFRNGSFGSNCGGLVGASARNITLQTCSFDTGLNGSINPTNGGGLIGGNSGNITGVTNSNIDIYNSWVRGTIGTTSGGLVGNTSNIRLIQDSYHLGTASNNNGIRPSGTTIFQTINTTSTANTLFTPSNPQIPIGNITLDKQLNITSTIESNLTTTGALVVSGGIGITSNLNVGVNINIVGI